MPSEPGAQKPVSSSGGQQFVAVDKLCVVAVHQFRKQPDQQAIQENHDKTLITVLIAERI